MNNNWHTLSVIILLDISFIGIQIYWNFDNKCYQSIFNAWRNSERI